MKKTRPQTLSERKFFSLFLCLLLGSLGCWCFSLKGAFALLMIPLGALSLSPGIQHFLKGRSDSIENREFLRLIEFLSSRVSAGHHIEAAFTDAPRHIHQDLRARSPLLRSLKKASRSLRSGLALHSVLGQFAADLSSPHSRRFCRVLPEVVRQGAKSGHFLQNYRDQLQKEQETLEELRAEQSSVSGECLIMSLMPFLMAAIGKTIPGFRASLEGRGQVVAIIFCELSFLLFSLSLHLSVFKTKDRPAANSRLLPARPHPLAKRLGRFLLEAYPGDIGYRLRARLMKLYPADSLIWEKFIQLKLLLTLVGFLLLLVAAIGSGEPLFLALTPLPPLLLDLKLVQSGRESSEAERQQYPSFLNLMSLLLGAGLSLDRSLRLCLRVLTEKQDLNKKAGRKESILARDLRLAARQMKSGASASQILRFLGQRQSRSEIAQVLHMMARYEQEGGREQLSLIRMQALQSREIYRLSMRRRLSRRGFLYLIPMGLDLFLVIAVTAWPALRNLGTSF